MSAIDDFVDYSESGASKFLDWKKQGNAMVWLHTKQIPRPYWGCRWPRIVKREDRESRRVVSNIWMQRWFCLDPESVLRKRNMRDKETGERLVPSPLDPIERMVEVVRRKVFDGIIEFTDEVFKFTTDDDSLILRAGGLYGHFGWRGLSGDEQRAMYDLDISPKEAWKEKVGARCEYIFTVFVPDVSDECQVTIETVSLGNEMKSEIRKQQKSRRDKGDPTRNPYPFLWEYDKTADMDARYSVVAMCEEAITPEVRSVVIDTAPPDISYMYKHGSVKTLMEEMMEAAVPGIFDGSDWDDIFGPALAAFPEKKHEGADKKHEGADKKSENANQGKGKGAGKKGEDTSFNPDEFRDPNNLEDDAAGLSGAAPTGELYNCDVCGVECMKVTDVVCPSCSTMYDPKTNKPILTKPKSKPRPRSAAST